MLERVFVASYKNLLEKVDTAAARRGLEAEEPDNKPSFPVVATTDSAAHHSNHSFPVFDTTESNNDVDNQNEE